MRALFRTNVPDALLDIVPDIVPTVVLDIVPDIVPDIAPDICFRTEPRNNIGVIHGDIKPENLLAASRPHLARQSLRWTDFGFASIQESSTKSNPPGATAIWAPPELLAAADVGKCSSMGGLTESAMNLREFF